MKTIFSIYICVLLLFVYHSSSSAQIVLSEIMFNPLGNDQPNEFIEIYNGSANQSIDVAGWLIGDGDRYNRIQDFNTGTLILAQQYAIIFVPNYYEQSLCYESIIPENALKLTIDHSTFGLNGLANSRSEPVSLYTPDTVLVGTYAYSVPNADGISEEKINVLDGDVPENWNHSKEINGTPGFTNSISKLPFNLALDGLRISPDNPTDTDSVDFSFWIFNRGGQPVEGISIIIYEDGDNNRVFDPGEMQLVYYRHKKALPASDSARFKFSIAPLHTGIYDIILEVRHPSDLDSSDNRAGIRLLVLPDFKFLVINEIMYNTEEKSQEWIELYNASQVDIDLKDFAIKDRRKKVILIEQSFWLRPNSYVVISNDPIAGLLQNLNLVNPDLPEWNNSSDDVVILGPSGHALDSVAYTYNWGGDRMVSLERIKWDGHSNNPANWVSSLDKSGASPGRNNSQSPGLVDVAIYPETIEWWPANPGAGQPVTFYLKVENVGGQMLPQVSVKLMRYASLTDSSEVAMVPVGGLEPGRSIQAELTWPQPESGIHELCLRAVADRDEQPLNDGYCFQLTVGYAKNSLVINEIMYSPLAGQSEWFECYNPGGAQVDLMNWSISDSDTSKRIDICDSHYMVQSGEFVLICESYPDNIPIEGDQSVVIARSWNALSGDEDGVMIYDGVGRIVDEVLYAKSWGGEKGRSLERINPHVASPDETNWSTCVDPAGHTAGRTNSIYLAVIPRDVSLDISPSPFSPDGDGFEDAAGISYAISAKTAFVNIKIFDSLGRLVRFLCNYERSGAHRTLFWDGKDDREQRCRIGVYIIYLEAFDDKSGMIQKIYRPCVLAMPL